MEYEHKLCTVEYAGLTLAVLYTQKPASQMLLRAASNRPIRMEKNTQEGYAPVLCSFKPVLYSFKHVLYFFFLTFLKIVSFTSYLVFSIICSTA